MKRAETKLHARAGIVAALVAALVLAACLEAYVTHSSPPDVHHEQWTHVERPVSPGIATPVADAGPRFTDLQPQPVAGAFVQAWAFTPPDQPYRSAPAAARAPPPPPDSVL